MFRIWFTNRVANSKCSKKKEGIPLKKIKWDFSDFFSSLEEFLSTVKLFQEEIFTFENNRKNYSLEKQLKKYYELSLMAEKLLSYAELNSDLDISNANFLEYKNKVYFEKSKLESIKNRINEEILKIEEPLDIYLEKHPEAKSYRMHFYEVLRLKEHTINSNVISNENVLISQVNSLYNTIMQVEMPLEEIEINQEKLKVNGRIYNRYITSQNREIREKIFKTYMGSLKNVNKSICNLFNMRYKMCFDIAKENGYKSILEEVIIKEDLDTKIYENLLCSVHENIFLLNRYIDLKKQKLGIEELHFYDMNINSEYNPKYSFEEGLFIVKEALKDLGKEYKIYLDKVINGGIIDPYPKKHKFSGGYHWRNYTKPMILMNYKENFREVATIGHEIGHAVNGLMIKENQEFQNFHFSIFLSEIASTVNEDLVEEYMYNVTTKENKIIHLEQIIDKTVASIFFQTMFFEFQKRMLTKIEQEGYVNEDTLNETFLTLFKEYYSNLTPDQEIKYLWQTRIHFFYDVHRYYNFQYAIGKIVALVINKNIKKGNIENYLKFLTIGGAKPTLETLAIGGIDLANKEIYENAFLYLEKLLDEYELLVQNE